MPVARQACLNCAAIGRAEARPAPPSRLRTLLIGMVARAQLAIGGMTADRPAVPAAPRTRDGQKQATAIDRSQVTYRLGMMV